MLLSPSSLQVHGNTRRIPPLFHGSFLDNGGMRSGHHQPIFTIFQLRPNISSGAIVATDNDIFILRNVFDRLLVPHVLFGESLAVIFWVWPRLWG